MSERLMGTDTPARWIDDTGNGGRAFAQPRRQLRGRRLRSRTAISAATAATIGDEKLVPTLELI